MDFYYRNDNSIWKGYQSTSLQRIDVLRGSGFGLQMKKNHLTVLFVFCLGIFSFNGCEDDPLLAPQAGSEEDKGSYGNIVPLQDPEVEIREKNPEIF